MGVCIFDKNKSKINEKNLFMLWCLKGENYLSIVIISL